ncbi:MAG TPA: IS66 family transposase [Polyangiales bacterium]|nr:IS66 family transposase [Polyangiales bacterium]
MSSDDEHKPAMTVPKLGPVQAPGALPMPRALLTAGVELDPATERERESRMEDLKTELGRMLADGKGQAVIDRVLSLVIGLERENERIAWRLLRELRYRFGRQSEKLSREELAQLFLALGGDEASTQNAELVVPAPTPPDVSQNDDASQNDDDAPSEQGEPAEPPKKPRKPRTGIKIADFVERHITQVPVPDEDRICALCGAEKKLCKHVRHERIEFVPAKIVVHVEVREMLACAQCRKDVSVAPRQTVPALGRRVEASLIAKLLHDKCANALPLHRQGKELARLGLEIPEKTLQAYFAYGTDALEPVADCVVSTVLGSGIVGADDTRLKVLDVGAKHGRSLGHLWCFVGTDGTVGGAESVGYTFAPSWDAEEIRPWFSAIEGDVQCDGYAGYARELDDQGGTTFVAVPDCRRLGCTMHVRSKCHAALLAGDKRAAIALKYIADLYKIEAECKAAGLDAAGRTSVRLERSVPIFDRLYNWIEDIHPRLLPSSPLRTATTYALNQQSYLRRCFEDGRFEIDNGRVERRIRPFAVGRRNFLFTGSTRGGERLAVAYTLVDNCLLLGLDPRRYLEDVLTKVAAGWPLRRLVELTPARWAIEHAR